MSELKAIEEIGKEQKRADDEEYAEIEESVKRTLICGTGSRRQVGSPKR
jgi:hypothetical protein